MCGTRGNASEVRTTVKYLSATSVYLDAGRNDSLQVGDRALITRGGDSVAVVEVLYLSSKSASCNILSSKTEIKPGDEVVVQIHPPAPASVVVKGENPLPIPTPTVVTSSSSNRAGSGFMAHGRIGFDYFSQNDRTIYNYDYSEPSVSLASDISSTGPGQMGISIRARFRRQDHAFGSSSRWDNRYYEASLHGVVPGAGIGWTFGRTTPGNAPGVGYIDGATANMQLSPDWRFSAFGGAEPNSGSGGSDWKRKKVGVVASYEKGSWGEQRISASGALVGSYYDGRIEREFIYIDNDIALTPSLSVNQSADIDVNRGWRKSAEGSSLTVSSFLLSASYDITRDVSFNLGYDNRKPIHYYEDRLTPDSLFDHSIRQGFRAGVSSRLVLGLRGSLDGTYNAAAAGSKAGSSVSANVYHPDFAGLGLSMNLRGLYFNSGFGYGWQPGVSLSRQIIGGLNGRLDGGANFYHYSNGSVRSQSSRWVRGGLDVWFARGFYASASFEAQRGGGYDADRITAGCGAGF